MRPVALFMMLFLWSAFAHADEASHEAAARELLEVSRAAEMIDTMYEISHNYRGIIRLPQFRSLSWRDQAQAKIQKIRSYRSPLIPKFLHRNEA